MCVRYTAQVFSKNFKCGKLSFREHAIIMSTNKKIDEHKP